MHARIPSRILFGVALTLACADGDGPSHPAPFYSVQVNGQAWPSDTAIAIAFGSPTDTTLSVVAARTLSPAQEQEIAVSLHGFTDLGQAELGDSSAQGIGSFAISQISGGIVVSTTVYRTVASPPGSVTITRLDRSDSTVTGTFAFEAALTPDTAPHQHISGSSSLRLGFIPVFTVP